MGCCGGNGKGIRVTHVLGALRRITLCTGRVIASNKPFKSADERAAALEICRNCGTLYVDEQGREWCGPPLQDHPGQSCGCMIRLKTKCGPERCPQGKW